MKRILVTLAIFAAGILSGWLARPILPTPPTTFQYELIRTPNTPYFQSKKLATVEWQMCQLGQKYYCSILAGDDGFTAHLKAEGRY